MESPQGDPKEAARIIFDITFFFFVIVILLAILQGLNIIFSILVFFLLKKFFKICIKKGLIIDAFGELRDQLESVKETLEVKKLWFIFWLYIDLKLN